MTKPLGRPLIHGKRSTYVNYKCRCPECTTANAEYKTRTVNHNIHVRASTLIENLFTDKEDPFTHGTPVAYEWHGCRCYDCSEAAKEAWKQARITRELRR